MDTYADILADAKRTQTEAARALMAIERGGPTPAGMSREEALSILKQNILATQAVIDRLGWRDA